MRCFAFLNQNDDILGYWHGEKTELPERCRALADELGNKVYYYDGYIEKEAKESRS